MTVRIINADVFEGLAQLDDESVQCVVTSPPYWGLRCYGVEGQLGLEPTLSEHIDKMVAVFAEVHRVLRKDGTLWLNYGDCYASSVNGRSAADTKAAGKDDRTFRDKPFSTVGGVLKAKDLCMIPNRLAIALQEAGWWVRSEIIWFKPNPMPESIKDRPTSSHEKIWLLSKSQQYFYDADAIREDSEQRVLSSWADRKKHEPVRRGDPGISGHVTTTATLASREGRNKRNVWTIATAPYSEAHFATFPPDLPETCIKAGSRIGDMILDPFGGAGTTGLVADKLGRNAILIELNPEYAAMAERRIQSSAPLFAQVETTAPEKQLDLEESL
ncbi:MAG TPA: site-specific DNA-methyltransferase [Hyphomicrobiales bacterium]|nr:site-specific DNA-methyltransferase [Hyphomicrobiales bacterium]